MGKFSSGYDAEKDEILYESKAIRDGRSAFKILVKSYDGAAPKLAVQTFYTKDDGKTWEEGKQVNRLTWPMVETIVRLQSEIEETLNVVTKPKGGKTKKKGLKLSFMKGGT